MKSTFRRAATVVASLALASAALAGATQTAYAGTPASAITTDPNASMGTVAFYDASGSQLTSGSLNTLQYTYAVASAPKDRPQVTPQKATVFYALPDRTQSDSQNWFSGQVTASTVYPVTTVGAPAVVTGAGANTPVNTMKSGDQTIAQFLGTGTMDGTAGWQNFVQVRMFDSAPGQSIRTAPFYASVIEVNTAANTWSQVFPTPPAPKVNTSVSAITPSPASPASHGSTVTLTATLTAADNSHPAGSVHLFDGTTDKGAATFTAATGAISGTDAPADGVHHYKFAFTPTDTAIYNGSESAVLDYTVNAAASTSTTLAANPASPAELGTSVTLTATVSPSAAGSVQFKDNGTNLGSPVTVSSGVATTTWTAVAPTTSGGHALTAVFTSTDVAFKGSTSNTVTYTVNPHPAASTSTTLNVTPASPQNYGTQLTLTGSVSPANAVGSVTFFDGSTQIGATQSWAGSPVTVSTSTLAAGTHSLTAQFVPTDTAAFGTSTSSATNFVVNAASTTTTLDPIPSVNYGGNSTLLASVSPSNVAGTVQFKDNGTNLGSPVTASSGTASLDRVFDAGSHAITAQFTPTDANHTGSTSSPQNFVVARATTTTSVASNNAAPTFGQAITLTATLSPSAAAGSVQFTVDGVAKGTPVPVSGGTATLNVSDLTTGTHAIGANFVGGTNYADSAAVPVNVTVSKATTTTTLTASPSGNVGVGTSVTLHAAVAPASAAGEVTFLDGATPLATVAVSGGVAELVKADFAPGGHSLTASFAPTDTTNVDGSTSSAVVLNIVPATSTTLAGPGAPVGFGADATFTATVTSSAGNPPGSVQFFEGATVLGTEPVIAGTATFTTSALGSGVHSIAATFVPADPTAFGQSTSSPVSVTVNPQATTVTVDVSPSSPVLQGTAVKVTATLTPATATGTVQFSDNGTLISGNVAVAGGKATFTTSTLVAGDHSIAAAFVPADAAKFDASQTAAAVALTVKPKPSMVNVTDINGRILKASATLKAGAKITLHAKGFVAGETVSAAVHSTAISVGTFTAAEDGTVVATLTIPSGLTAGSHTVTLTGANGAASYSFRLAAKNVTNPPPGGTETLSTGTTNPAPTTGAQEVPNTGAIVRAPLVAALTFLALGALMIGFARPRRRARHGR